MRWTEGRTTLAWLLGFTVIALALRVVGLDFGMPLLSNLYVRPDESLIVEPAVRLGQDPRFFAYPALLSHLVGLVARFDHALRPGAPPFAAWAGADLGHLFLLARGVSALAGALTVWPIFFAARSVTSRAAALAAAALYALAPLPVRDSHYGVTDTLMTLLVAVVFELLCGLPEGSERRGRRLAWLGIGIGMAVAAKYTAAGVAPAVVLGAAWTARRDRRALDVAIVTVAALLAFAALNPFLLVHGGEFLATARMIAGGVYSRPGVAGAWTPAQGLSQLVAPLRLGAGGGAGALLAFAALVLGLRSPERRYLSVIALLAFAGLAGPLFLAHYSLLRYGLPCLPIVAVGLASGLGRLPGRRPEWLVASLAAAFAIGPTSQSLALAGHLTREDTRTLAGRWMGTRLPEDCVVYASGAPELEPQLQETRASLERRVRYALRLYGNRSGEVVARPYLLRLAAPDPEGRSFEVYRDEAPPSDSSCVCEVSGSYPGFASSSASSWKPAAGQSVTRLSFDPFASPDPGAATSEPFDAFFLPIVELDGVERPGPRLTLTVYRR